MLDIRKDKRRGDDVNARAHAKLVVQTRKHVDRLATTKAQLSSVCMQLKEQQATVKMAGAMQSSTQLMQSMQRMVGAPGIASTARQYAMEMQRAGLLQEMATDVIDDAMEMAGEAAEVEDDEVEAVIAGVLAKDPATPSAQSSVAAGAQAASSSAQQEPHEPAGLSASSVVEAMPSAPSSALQQPTQAQAATSHTRSPILAAGSGGLSRVHAAAAQGGGASPGSPPPQTLRKPPASSSAG